MKHLLKISVLAVAMFSAGNLRAQSILVQEGIFIPLNYSGAGAGEVVSLGVMGVREAGSHSLMSLSASLSSSSKNPSGVSIVDVSGMYSYTLLETGSFSLGPQIGAGFYYYKSKFPLTTNTVVVPATVAYETSGAQLTAGAVAMLQRVVLKADCRWRIQQPREWVNKFSEVDLIVSLGIVI